MCNAFSLAPNECFDSLAALVYATQRALVEPRAVQPPLTALGRILGHSYQLLAQLTSVKTMLLLKRDRLELERIAQPLREAALGIESMLRQPTWSGVPQAKDHAPSEDEVQFLPDPFEGNLTPWLLRRLNLAQDIARELIMEVAALDGTPNEGLHGGLGANGLVR